MFTLFAPPHPQLIIGDNAYPALPNLVPVYPNEQGISADERNKRIRFNKILSSVRILVEQGLGTLKMRFPYILD